MNRVLWLIFLVIIAVVACKSDKKADTSNRSKSETVQGQHEQKSKKSGKNRKTAGLLSAKMDSNFPKSSYLLSPEDIVNVFNVQKDAIKITADQYKPESGFSRTVWTWYDRTDSFHKITVVMNRNPSPDDLVEWGKRSLDNYLKQGIPYTDGTKVSFEDINYKGTRYIWAEQGPMLKWFYKDDISFTLVGIGHELDKNKLLKLAGQMLDRLKSYKNK